MVRSVADRAFLPAKNLLEEVGDMMILTGKTIVSALRPPYPYGREFVSRFLFAPPPPAAPLGGRVRQPVPVRPAAVLVPPAHLDGRLRLRRSGSAGGELPG